MSQRFTIDGSQKLEKHLEDVCSQVRERVSSFLPADKLEAIFLGGGYGRGEGGVLHTDNGDRPYNDLEFYICIRGNPRLNERSFGHDLHELGEELSKLAGIEVEFKIASLKTFGNSRPSMFLYDLAMGHRTLVGSDEVLRAPKLQDPKQIPLHEATRLLMNRCSGLLFCEEKLSKTTFTQEDADFVGRNHAKAQLALGDVVLTMLGQYHWSCRERSRRLQKLTEGTSNYELPLPLSKIVCHHALGVEFKLHPKQSTGCAEEFRPLQVELREIARSLWLCLENRRLSASFSSIRDYALSNINKCPETSALKNRLINLKQFGIPGFFGKLANRYPRERLLQGLALLLWEWQGSQRMNELGKIQEDLNTVSTNFNQLMEAYRSLWKNFN